MTQEEIERVGNALQIAWNSADVLGDPAIDLPPIDLTPDERNYLARAAIAALDAQRADRP